MANDCFLFVGAYSLQVVMRRTALVCTYLLMMMFQATWCAFPGAYDQRYALYCRTFILLTIRFL